MAFLVSARKYRPQRFDEVVGQEQVVRTIKNSLKSGKIAHSYIFTGPRGVGKTTTARLLAKILNCSNPTDFEPCNECNMCKSFLNQQSMDIIEIDAASNRRIEEIRTLRESVKYAPTVGKYKVYIIDEVHMLTNESFNALLKTLEEPPEHVIFIFATTDIHKVPLTIISRCQRYDFRRMTNDDIKKQLRIIAEAEKIEIADEESLNLIAKKADGAMRDAESIFDQVVAFCGNKISFDQLKSFFSLIDEETYFRLTDAVLSKDFSVVFDISNTIYDNGWNYIEFLNSLTEFYRNLLVYATVGEFDKNGVSELVKNKFPEYKNQFSVADVLRIVNYLNKVIYEVRVSQNQRVKVELSLCNLVALEKTSTISDIIDNLSKLQEQDVINSDSEKKKIVRPTFIPKPNIIEVAESQTAYNAENRVKPLAANVTEGKSIAETWSVFCDYVAVDKPLLQSYAENLRIVDEIGNRVVVELIDDKLVPSSINIETLTEMLKYFYRKKIILSVKLPEKVNDNDDEYIKFIVNNLGGKEI